jgi:protein O-mannosyl-transferase
MDNAVTRLARERPGLFSYAVVVSAGLLLYAGTLWYGLTYFDDNVWVQNTAWRIDSWHEAWAVFTRRDAISYLYFRPMLNLSFFLNASLGHNSIALYHLMNLALHLLGGCLFLTLLRRLRFSDRLALALALVFIAHPALTQAVAWIPGRTESLVAVFILLSFINFVACLEDHRPGHYVGHQLFLLAALLSKEVAVVLPVACMLYALIVRRKKPFDPENVCFAVGWVLMAAAYLMFRFNGLHGEPGLGNAYDVHKLLENLPVVFHSLGSVLWPAQLSVLPGREALRYLPGIIGGIVLVVLLLLKSRARLNFFTQEILDGEKVEAGPTFSGLGWFGLLWFVLFVLPGLLVATFFFEYRLYLPVMGILIALAVTPPMRWLETRPRLFWAVFALAIVALSWVNQRQVLSFRDKISYWEAAAQGQPGSAFIQNSLGAAYQMEGLQEKAVEQYQKVLRINPYEPIVHNNLGLIAVSRGDYKAALQEYWMEITINNSYPNVYLNLGGLYFAMNEYNRAQEAWEQARKLNPQDLRAVKSLIKLYLETGETAKAQALMDSVRGRVGGN